MLSAMPRAGCWRWALGNRAAVAAVSICSGVPGGRWGKWERNKCYLFDKLKFTLSLVPSSGASGILTLAGDPGQSWIAHRQPGLSQSLPQFPYLLRQGQHPMLWPQRVFGCSQCYNESKWCTSSKGALKMGQLHRYGRYWC